MVLNTPSMTYAQAVAECEATAKGQLAFFYSEMDVNTATGSIMGAWGITVWDIIGRKRWNWFSLTVVPDRQEVSPYLLDDCSFYKTFLLFTLSYKAQQNVDKLIF